VREELEKAAGIMGSEARRSILGIIAANNGASRLAELVGRSRSTISRYLSGSLDPPPSIVAEAIMKADLKEVEAEVAGLLLYEILPLCLGLLEEYLPSALESSRGEAVGKIAARLKELLSHVLGEPPRIH